VFVRSGTVWNQQAYLKASNTGLPFCHFGATLGISGETLVVGAPWERSGATGVNGDQYDTGASGSGAVYVFVRNGTNWTQQAYIKASNTGAIDQFGTSVAVEGNLLAIGAVNEASAATMVNGDQNDNTATNSGAAYVFERHETTWTQQAYLKASNSEGLTIRDPGDPLGDRFGASVAVGDGFVAVGAPGEDSTASGINGDQSDNSLRNPGAVYIFSKQGNAWAQQGYVKASTAFFEEEFGTALAVSGDTVLIAGLQNSYVFTGINPRPRLTIAKDDFGGYWIRFTGESEMTYELHRALGAAGPWITIATFSPDETGQVEFHDVSPPPRGAFYRIHQH